MRSLPEKDFWNILRTRLRNYEEKPTDNDDDWELIAAALKPAPWYKRRSVIVLALLLLVSGTTVWVMLPSEAENNALAKTNSGNNTEVPPAASIVSPHGDGDQSKTEEENAGLLPKQDNNTSQAEANNPSATAERSSQANSNSASPSTAGAGITQVTGHDKPGNTSERSADAQATARADQRAENDKGELLAPGADTREISVNKSTANMPASSTQGDTGNRAAVSNQQTVASSNSVTTGKAQKAGSATNDDVRSSGSATKDDVRNSGSATKGDVRNSGSATKGDVRNSGSATKGDVRNSGSATKGDVRNSGSATKGDVRNSGSATNGDVRNSGSATNGDAENSGSGTNGADISKAPTESNTIADTSRTNIAAVSNTPADTVKHTDTVTSGSGIADQAAIPPVVNKDSTIAKAGDKKKAPAKTAKEEEQKRKAWHPVLYFSLTPSLAFQKVTPTRNDDIHISGLQEQSMLSGNRAGISLETGAQITLVKGFDLYGGLAYYQQNQSVTYNYTLPSSTNINSQESMDYVITPEGGTHTFRYAMRNAGVSAGFLYTVKDAKLMHKIGAGLQYQRGFMKARSGDTYENSGAQYLNYQVHYRLEWAATRAGRTRLFVQPAFIHSFWSHETLREPLTLKPYRVGISFGVNVAF